MVKRQVVSTTPRLMRENDAANYLGVSASFLRSVRCKDAKCDRRSESALIWPVSTCIFF